jgi:hypothetical protein
MTYFADGDMDGFGDPLVSVAACVQPAGFVADNTDCNDADGAVNPGEAEVCDTKDNDCDGGTADGSAEAWFGMPCDGPDGDLCEEGSFECTGGVQTCSDATGDTLEICANTIDDDCDTEIDEVDCVPPAPPLGEPQIAGLGGGQLVWTPVSQATTYHLYRGGLAKLVAEGLYTQDPAGSADAERFCFLAGTEHADAYEPGSGQVVFYIVTADDGSFEGTLGKDGAGQVRPNDNPCR